MEQRLEAIRSSVQKLAVVLKYEEVSEYVVIPEKRTLLGRIRENMCIYLQDLNHGNSKDLFIPFEISEKDWDKELDNSC
ncbi:4650_t:CDS:2 [Gigaspora margarita]|uniref:4650_t:CDS:1 n=1 Tax=Gigaspora margarita TaxID=4874 RepID=A0ABN7WT72_GIGMA|nr:4650_t:CDS:2 [Gigaspora margarita]